jgi:Xaa-Pro aminopeptidase
VVANQAAVDHVSLRRRLTRAQQAADAAGVDALLITPGPDLRYLIGYDAVALERLTCLVVPTRGEPVLVLPALEVLAAQASGVEQAGVHLESWQETDDAWERVAAQIPDARVVAVADHMWAMQVLRAREVMPAVTQRAAGLVLQQLRMVKDAQEMEFLAEAGRAIDWVHGQVAALLAPGRTEREVGADIAELILAAGHSQVDFVIVASGPNGASPHHAVSDRILQRGDAIVVDIGGTMPSGYCSDCTRTYAIGDPGPQYRQMYAVLKAAQEAAVAGVSPGTRCAAIDAIARSQLAAADLGSYFIHRTGHGIGLETHEDPYIVEGNERPLEPGMAFSVEPGFYLPDRYGARIEDIVICTIDGSMVLNRQPRELVCV